MTDPQHPAPPKNGQDDRDQPAVTALAYGAGALRVVAGANQGDDLGRAAEAEPGDIYQLSPEARPIRLRLAPSIVAPDGGGAPPGLAQLLAGGDSAPGLEPGQPIAIAATLVLMSARGERVEVLVLRIGESGAQARVLALPLSPLSPWLDYVLIARDDSAAAPGLRLADVLCASFSRGTEITLADGRQCRIEDLTPGMKILTRDHGAQPLAWIGRATLRAAGGFAPVVIGAGALGNAGDLIVSPHHRLFLYQPADRPRLGAMAELLVQAKHLADGQRIWRREGGFVDYFSLAFAQHEIVYAEGIPCESLQVSAATLALIPPDLAAELRARFPGLQQSAHIGHEPDRSALDGEWREQLLAARAQPR